MLTSGEGGGCKRASAHYHTFLHDLGWTFSREYGGGMGGMWAESGGWSLVGHSGSGRVGRASPLKAAESRVKRVQFFERGKTWKSAQCTAAGPPQKWQRGFAVGQSRLCVQRDMASASKNGAHLRGSGVATIVAFCPRLVI